MVVDCQVESETDIWCGEAPLQGEVFIKGVNLYTCKVVLVTMSPLIPYDRTL